MSWYDWIPKALPTIIQAGGTIYGAVASSTANAKAAEIGARATADATAATLQGQADARTVIEQQRGDAASGLARTNEVIRRGDALTPAQQDAMGDARNQVYGQLQASGLRGSGRAMVASVRDVEGRMRNQFMDSNAKRADSAASGLVGQHFNAGNSIANTYANSGTALAQGATAIGDINAGQATSGSELRGRAIGDIGAIIADDLRQRNRPKPEDQTKPSEA